ncbi:hypothetical protein [Pelomonas cellulosilytica]|uniref:hypothetical protein n=1 Tax=Pelomonas cellulosilytica TaxID=2906762 RepID=UPI003B014F17
MRDLSGAVVARDLAGLVRRVFERARQLRAWTGMKARLGITHLEEPALDIAGFAAAAADGDATAAGVLDCVDDEVLCNAPDLDRIGPYVERGGTGVAKVKATLPGVWLQVVAQRCQQRGGVEGLQGAAFQSALQPCKARHVVEELAQRADVAVQEPQEAGAHGFRDHRRGEARGGGRHHAEVAAQVVRRLLPQPGALLLKFAQGLRSTLQVPDVAARLDLLQREVLRRAGVDRVAALLAPDAPCARHAAGVQVRMGDGVLLQFVGDAFVQPSEFASHFCQVEALLPAVQPVGSRVALWRWSASSVEP